MCYTVFVQRFEPRGRHFTNSHYYHYSVFGFCLLKADTEVNFVSEISLHVLFQRTCPETPGCSAAWRPGCGSPATPEHRDPPSRLRSDDEVGGGRVRRW